MHEMITHTDIADSGSRLLNQIFFPLKHNIKICEIASFFFVSKNVEQVAPFEIKFQHSREMLQSRLDRTYKYTFTPGKS